MRMKIPIMKMTKNNNVNFDNRNSNSAVISAGTYQVVKYEQAKFLANKLALYTGHLLAMYISHRYKN